ncbi:hypothetical protein Tco_0656094 [Tanacetum coccineum]|uniref:Uncharacterized protein n=1 Tax=Tanacetum coccineum TaxID=301880 RepID=A0ABQ4X8F8_9ASTR
MKICRLKSERLVKYLIHSYCVVCLSRSVKRTALVQQQNPVKEIPFKVLPDQGSFPDGCSFYVHDESRLKAYANPYDLLHDESSNLSKSSANL